MRATRGATNSTWKSLWRRLFARALLVIAGSLLGGVLVEAGCCCYLCLFPSPAYIGRWEFRSTCPPPYRDADYFNSQFLCESMCSVRVEMKPGAGFRLPGDFTGRYINAHNGRRRTTDQPSAFTNKVLLFGGSTIFSHDVPDEWTVASCLQRLLNRQCGDRWCVENHGTSSMIAAQQTERLRQVQLHTGDVVLFYDGVNDVCYPIYNGNPSGWHSGQSHDGGVRRLNRVQRLLYPLCLRYKDTSATAAVFFHRLDEPLPRNMAKRKVLQQHLHDAELGYRNALVEANRIAHGQGAKFVHFLQPNIFTLGKPSAFEASVAANDLKVMPGLDRAYAVGYPALRRAIAAAKENGVVSFDLTWTLDEREAGQEYYLDFCHVNHTANERIAQGIFKSAFGKEREAASGRRRQQPRP